MAVYSSVSKTHISYTTLICAECGWEVTEDGKEHGLLILTKEVSTVRYDFPPYLKYVIMYL